VDELDTSFLTEESHVEYIETIRKVKQRESSVGAKFSETSKGLLEILKSMLQFNPHFRPTAAQLLNHKIFDNIR